MIFQRWVMSRCDGRPQIALKRIEDVAVKPVDYHILQRSLRQPLPLPIRIAQLVVAASDGECTLPELLDPDIIRKRFQFERPQLHARALEFAILRAQRARAKQVKAVERARALLAETEAEIVELQAERAALVSADTGDAAA